MQPYGQQKRARVKRPPVYVLGAEVACRRCGKPFIVTVRGQRLCHDPCIPLWSGASDHAGSAQERGYGVGHQRQRREAIEAWQDGDPCARCDGPMYYGTPVDLDHTDDRTGYIGLSHASCNRSHTGRLDHVKHPKVCDHCGLTYLTSHPEQRYCSVVCRKAAPKPGRAVQSKPVRVPRWHHRECPTCSAVFMTRVGQRVYCCADCSYAKGLTCATCARPIKRSATARPQGEAICHPCRPATLQRRRIAA